MIRALALLLALKVSHAQAQEQITQHGPWIGYWAKARLSAYSPHDALDRAYHESKGERWRWITADGQTDVRRSPYGIAASGSLPLGSHVFIPTGHGYLDRSRVQIHQRRFRVDDRGGLLNRFEKSEKVLCLDLRFRTEYSALAFGVKDAWVFIITGDAP